MSIQTTILDKIAIVDLGFTIWSGAKALEPTDFVNVDVSDLPSARVASYGRKNLIDKDALQPFKQIRTKAERVCTRVGTRLLGGFAVPQDSIDQIGQELDSLCVEFEQELDKFMTSYDDMIEDWITSNPEMAEPLRRAVMPRAVVKSRFRASFSIFEVNASSRDRTNSMAKVGTDLLDSILAQVVGAFKSHIESKRGHIDDSYRVEVRQTVGDMAAKMSRFAFIEPSGGMKILADKLAAAVTGQGKIAGQEFLTLYGLLRPLKSVTEAKRVIADYAQAGVSAPAPHPDPQLDLPAAPAPKAEPPQDGFGFEPSEFATDKREDTPAGPPASADGFKKADFLPLDFDVPEEPSADAPQEAPAPEAKPSSASAWAVDFGW